MLDPLYNALGAVLAFFYAIVPNVGFAIIMLTVVVRLILFPLTAKQAKSMIAMQRAQPEIKKLQAKYKTTPAGMLIEMNPKTTGMTLPMICICGLTWVWFRIVWRCWKNALMTTRPTRM